MNRTRLRQFIEEESTVLTRTLAFYLHRSGLTISASELLNEIVVEALKHEERFDPARQPRAWLLGIGANLIRRKQTELARLNWREPLAGDLYPDSTSGDDDDLFDWVASHSEAETHSAEATRDRVSALMQGLSPDDAQVVRLGILNGLDGDALAQELGVSPGAARVRLHRALNRLRRTAQAEKDHGDE